MPGTGRLSWDSGKAGKVLASQCHSLNKVAQKTGNHPGMREDW